MRDSKGETAQIAEMFYEGALDAGAWARALEAIARATGSAQALIVVRDKSTQQLRVEEHFNVPAGLVDEYNAHYHRHDPALTLVEDIPPGGWYHDRRDLGEAVMARSPFYQEYLWRHGFSTVVFNRLLDDVGSDAYLSLQRACGQPAYTEKDLERLAPLIGHVQRAVRLRSRLHQLTERGRVCEEALRLLRLPLLIVDDGGAILMANAEAEAFLARRGELAVRDGRLRLAASGDGRLETLLRKACGALGAAEAGGLRFGPRNGEASLVATPVPARLAVGTAWSRPLALVLLGDSQQAPAGGEDLLQEVYRLTPAEARVALSLARGGVPAQVAAELRVSLATVRTQMKSIFLKTGTARQADLVRTVQAVLSVSPRDPAA